MTMALVDLRVSKSTLSIFLRTKCDKELFLSLHDPNTMGAAGLPKPIKRPGIGTLAVEGKKFEVIRNDQLVQLFPAIVRYERSKNQYDDTNLYAELTSTAPAPRLILQGQFSIAAADQPAALLRIGISPVDLTSVPSFSGFIPDVVYVRRPNATDSEVRPDGRRTQVDALTDGRLALSIIDIKHTSEANPSYCSEIAMYALMMASWIDADPMLKSRYFVTSASLLWTRFKQGDSELERLQTRGGATTQQLLDALVTDCEDAQLRYYLSAIRGFFEDVARVVRVGLARADGWKDLEWHVASMCGSCDWLGDKRHMGKAGRDLVDNHANHYCMPSAEGSGHLCLVPGVTKGAKKVLCRNTVNNTSALAAAIGHPALQEHTLLKREAKTLPARSTAITTGNLSRDLDGAIASLVPSAHLLIYASINFDSSAGLLTGLSLAGVATAFTIGQSPRRFRPVAFVVDQKALAAEWDALQGFLTQIADFIENAEGIVSGSLTGQIHFWEQRQFQELCNAMGRHLPRVMTLSVRKAKALAWVFPSEDMISTADALEAAIIVAVDDIVRRLVFAPTRHVITLFDTVEHYRAGPSPAVRDSYYREYLNNGIPRERIYEIWSSAPMVKRGAIDIPRNTIISQYSDALIAQSKALEAICEKLRQDYRGQFRAKSARIPTAIPRGATGVAFDSKLWLWWDELNFAATQLEAHIKLSMDGERLEASYEAIVLKNGVCIVGDEYSFDVALGSTEAKFKEESMLTLGKIGLPGLPLQRVCSLIPPNAPAFGGDNSYLSMPLWSVLKAKLVNFDRRTARARVQLTAEREPQLVPYLMANSMVALLHDVFLVETKKPSAFNWAKHSAPILAQIGDPRIAVPDVNAARAMGITPAARRNPRAAETPAARVLWNPPALEQRSIVPPADACALAARIASTHQLNDSQEGAVAHAVERALTVIWGPPGTGKTNTLAAILHAIVSQAIVEHRALRVLIAGPTYKAVEEIVKRVIDFLNRDAAASSTIYMGYSVGRDVLVAPAGLQPHLQYRTMFFDKADADYADCRVDLQSSAGVTLVACQIRQARKFSKVVANSDLQEIFDVVVIDESSQVPVSHALAAFAGLRSDARLIIAGDHLQMPPIAAIEPPPDAAYLVGSVQTYLTKRTFAQPVPPNVLERNYRSNRHIVEFARTVGYPSTLVAEYPDTAIHLLQPIPIRSAYAGHLPWSDGFDDLLRPETKVATFLHEDSVSSQGNRFEAQVVAALIWMLRQSVSAELDGRRGIPTHRPPTPQEFWRRSVGIVTPHRAQRALVIQELENLFPDEINLIVDAVDTVERFQGGERHTILVTFGVADVDVIGGEEAFLMQLERTNVAVSRAMAKCIIVMPDALAGHIPQDKRALQTAHALKGYVEEFCNHRVATSVSVGADVRRAQVRYRS